MSLSERVIAFRSNVASVATRADYERQNVDRLRGKIKQIEEDKMQLVMALAVIDRTISIISANGIGKIESIVTAGLRLAFQDPEMGFVVEKKETANRGNTYRLLVRKKGVLASPMEAFGGGVVNVVSFLLRVIMTKRFKLAKFLVLDESFNNVSTEYLPQVSAMMTKLCNEHGYTILAVTHQPILASAADHVYQLRVDEQNVPSLHRLETDELDELHAATS